MSPEAASAVIAAGGFVLSLFGALSVSTYRSGRNDARLTALEMTISTLATKDQFAGLKEDVAEIKGMFRMTLRDGGS